MAHTRRAVMTGLATAPLAAAAAAAAEKDARTRFFSLPLPAPDPIFTVIERYHRSIAAMEAADERADPGFYAVAANEHIEACEALFNTVPTTLAGCRALAEYMLDDAADEVDSDCHRTLAVLAAALQRLAGPPPA